MSHRRSFLVGLILGILLGWVLLLVHTPQVPTETDDEGDGPWYGPPTDDVQIIAPYPPHVLRVEPFPQI
jgi:hypothetical protein